jgi:hypothetical protein
MRAITIAFALAQQPGRGGHTWVALQWALGFKKLGWDVLLLDRLDVEMAVDEGGAPPASLVRRPRPAGPRCGPPVCCARLQVGFCPQGRGAQ